MCTYRGRKMLDLQSENNDSRRRRRHGDARRVRRGHGHDHCAVDWNLARLAAKSSSWAARSSSSVMPEFSNLDTFFSRSWRASERWDRGKEDVTHLLCLLVVLEDVLDFCCEGVEAECLRAQLATSARST